MSSELQIIDDNFIPVKTENIEVHEVISKHSPRYYVLVNNENHNFCKLGVKEFFLWENIDNEKNLASLKQDYYQKFKTIPSQAVMDLFKNWLDIGFLDSFNEPEESFPFLKTLGVMETSFPVTFPRMILGSFSSFLNTTLFCAIYVFITLIALTGTISTEGAGILFRCFEYGKPIDFFIIAILAAYGTTCIRLLTRLGVLAKTPVYSGDRGFIGLAFFLPFIRINTRGLILKPFETRIINHVYLWLMPLSISSLSFICAIFLVPPETYTAFILYSVGLSSFIDFIVTSCPFYRSYLVRIFDEVSDTIPTYKLVNMYLHDSYQFNANNTTKHRKLLQYFLVFLFTWIVFGSSIIFLSIANFSDSLNIFLKDSYDISNERLETIQWVLYIPILISFIFFLWKLIQPFILRIIQHRIWENPIYLISCLSFTVIALSASYSFTPSLLGRSILLVFIGFSLKKLFSQIKIFPFYLKLHFGIYVATFIITLLIFFRPGMGFLTIPLSIAWTVWVILTLLIISPKSSAWLAYVLSSAFVLSLIYSSCVVIFNFPIMTISYTLGAGFYLATFFWFANGHLTTHFFLGFLVQCGFFLFHIMNKEIPEVAEASLCAALLSIQFQAATMTKAVKQALQTAPSRLLSLKDNSRKSIENSLKNFISYLLGNRVVFHLKKKELNDLSVLRFYETWLSKWLSKRNLLQTLKFALSAVTWDERSEWTDRLGNTKVSSLEKKSKLDLKKRMIILKGQLAFKSFNASELQLLVQLFEVNAYTKNQLIARQSEKTHPWLEIIVRGQAVMQKESPTGRVSSLATLGSMDAINGDDLIKDKVYDFSVRCTQDTMTVRLYRKHFEVWGKENPDLLKKFLDSVKLSQMIMRLSLFRDFSMAQMRILMEQLVKTKIKKGDDIIVQGDVGDKFYLLDDGNVDIVIHGNTVATLGSGSYFGEIALLEKCERTATVRAASSCTVYSLGQKDFDRFFSGGRSAQVLKNISSSRTEVNQHE